MLIRDIAEPKELFRAIDKCKGRVELVTDEGDRLNMRSTLCQYIALTQMFQDGRVDGIELVLSEPGDFERLKPYLVLGE